MKLTINKRLKQGTFLIEGWMNINMHPSTSMSVCNSWNRSKGSSSLRWQGSLWVWNLLRFVLTLLRNERVSNRDIFFSTKVHNVSIHHIYGMLFHIWTGEGTPETPAPSEFAVVELVATVVCLDCWFVLGSTAASDSNECTSEIEALRSFVSMIYQRGMSKALLDSWAWKGTSETPEPSELAIVDMTALQYVVIKHNN